MSGVGIYPGTFDPVHDGHIAFANAAMEKCQLDRVVFVPEESPRGKINVTDIRRRQAFLRARVHHDDKLDMQALGTRQFDVESTLPLLEALYPGERLALLIGSDVAAHLAQWPGISRLLSRMEIIVGMRSGADEVWLAEYLQSLGGTTHIVTTDKPHLSSTMYRP